jgi:hypothetical protein
VHLQSENFSRKYLIIYFIVPLVKLLWLSPTAFNPVGSDRRGYQTEHFSFQLNYNLNLNQGLAPRTEHNDCMALQLGYPLWTVGASVALLILLANHATSIDSGSEKVRIRAVDVDSPAA